MLSDIERKVLRIICNYDAVRHQIPTISEISIKTGREIAGIMEVLRVLSKEQYIEWSSNEPNKILIKERWERRNGSMTW